MPLQVWIQSRKEYVQKVKLLLDEAGHLSKAQKVKSGQQDGYMIIPTNKYHEEEGTEDEGYLQILSDFHLGAVSQYASAEVVYLPTSQFFNADIQEPRLGPIQEALSEWLETLHRSSIGKIIPLTKDLLESSPKRWSIYEPMLLLPSGSFQNATWKVLLDSLDDLSSLWALILHKVWKKEGGKPLTHLAVNSGIPSSQTSVLDEKPVENIANPTSPSVPGSPSSKPNFLRTPSGLILLYGDFGPSIAKSYNPTNTDLAAAFWVSCTQNSITQTWAPRYTMFSRGNIKEKARVLNFSSSDHGPADGVVVDLYAGIGYFAFSYVAASFKTVLCWEINPWSVEGLRRGSERNGWECKVLRGPKLDKPIADIISENKMARLVVFEESNERALERTKAMRNQGMLGNVVHVNCGLLPSSRDSWKGAWEIVIAGSDVREKRAWLHLHENVGAEEVERRRKEIEGIFKRWAQEADGLWIVRVEHVEFVKTFAPEVWHCVFDVLIRRSIKASS